MKLKHKKIQSHFIEGCYKDDTKMIKHAASKWEDSSGGDICIVLGDILLLSSGMATQASWMSADGADECGWRNCCGRKLHNKYQYTENGTHYFWHPVTTKQNNENIWTSNWNVCEIAVQVSRCVISIK